MMHNLIKTEEIDQALASGKPVVALESTVISHGLPYPTNLEAALQMEEIIRKEGAVPATMAILGGKVRVGVTRDELEHLASAKGIRKVSRRDLPIVDACLSSLNNRAGFSYT